MQNTTIPHSINGVAGNLMVYVGARAPSCFEKQKWVSESRPIKGYGAGGAIVVSIRYDDECRNKHNSFAITASVYTDRSRRISDIEAGGCLHDDIARVFPELAGLVQWHLFNADAPMHYVANTVYHATNWADSRFAPGAPCQWETRVRFGAFPITFEFSKRFLVFLAARQENDPDKMKAIPEGAPEFAPVAVPYVKRDTRDTYDFGPHYTVTGDDCKQWHEAPFKDLQAAREFCDAINLYQLTFEKVVTKYAGEKTRNLEAARSCANWPDATDAQLMADPEELKAALLARLPAMMERFRAAIENECGFTFEAPEKV